MGDTWFKVSCNGPGNKAPDRIELPSLDSEPRVIKPLHYGAASVLRSATGLDQEALDGFEPTAEESKSSVLGRYTTEPWWTAGSVHTPMSPCLSSFLASNAQDAGSLARNRTGFSCVTGTDTKPVYYERKAWMCF
jgi:hypothetical protein